MIRVSFVPRGAFARRVNTRWALFLLSATILAGSCSSGDLPLDAVDPGAVPDTTTYDQFFLIIQRECLPCHDDGGTEPPFDTCENVLANFDALVKEVFVTNTMPPGAWPRLSSEERLIIQRWSGEAPCTE